MNRFKAAVFLLVVLSIFHPLRAPAAEEKKIGGTVRPYFSSSVFSSGDLIKPATASFTANNARDRITLNTAASIKSLSTSFDDAFSQRGVGVEFGSSFTDQIGLHAGIVYRQLNGKSFDGFQIDGPATIDFAGLGSLTATQAGNIRVSMKDAAEWGIYAGMKMYPFMKDKLSFYVRGSLGLLQTDDITARIFLTEAPSQSIRVDFFDSKLLFYGEGGVGAEYKWGKFGFMGEVRLEWIQEREVTDGVSGLVSTEPILGVPVVLGVMWRF